jgi:hypothetical protein
MTPKPLHVRRGLGEGGEDGKDSVLARAAAQAQQPDGNLMGEQLGTGASGQARCVALTPCVPLSRRGARGNALQGAPPCAPTPLSHALGEGLGVRA